MANRRPLPALANAYSGLLEASAECDECEFWLESRNAVGLGNQHARRTGHQVRCIQIIAMTYNRKDGVERNYR